MNPVSLEFLTEQLELGEQLLAHRGEMLEPQDLPGRYGRVVRAIDHLLQDLNCESVLAGGWAVWRHGYFGRMTQDIDIVLPSARIEEFLRVAAVSGFEVFVQPEGRWPKLLHKETHIKVDILPEGGRPGTANKLAPTTIPHPKSLGAIGSTLRYIDLSALIELKLAAGRPRDEGNVAELLRVQLDQADAIRAHLAGVHPDYVAMFNGLVERARAQRDE
ncbi:MAG TPA: hypothetical protein VK395_02690 [Gemmataceae bacterium]|nr:hypothetical protein [Gemmataceae bacterium]